MRDVIRSNDVEIRSTSFKQIIIRGSGDSEFNNAVNKSFKLLPPIDILRIIANEDNILAKLSFDQWCLIFNKEISDLKIIQHIEKLNKTSSILATNFSDAQVFFHIRGQNAFKTLNKLTHFDFRKKSFKTMTSAQTLLARIDCSIFNLEDHLLLSCNRSFSDYLEDRLIDAVNF